MDITREDSPVNLIEQNLPTLSKVLSKPIKTLQL